MSIDKDRSFYLFNRYYQKIATDKEREELFLLLSKLSDKEISLLMEQEYNRLNIADYQSDEHKVTSALNEIFKKSTPVIEEQASDKKIFNMWRWLSIAASVLIIGFIVIYSANNQKGNPIVNSKAQLNEVIPGSDKATLTLGDGSIVILDHVTNKVMANEGHKVKINSAGQLVYTAKPIGELGTHVAINKVSTPRGGQFQVVLPDGSKAWLNAASSISFPTIFTQEKREVTMSGEVYFEIRKNGKPFIVNTNKGIIQVLGTHFNIMAYNDEKAMETTLLEGSIKLTSGNASRTLKPGEQAQLTSVGDIKMANDVDAQDAIAWKTGLFQFKDADVETVMRQLSRWYDLDVKYEGKMPQKQITGKISRNVNVSEVISMLSFAGINCKIEGKTIIVLKH